MPYDRSGWDADPEESLRLWKAVAAVVFCGLVALFVWVAISCAPNKDEMPIPGTQYQLQLDCSNAAQMHKYGLPTKADVIQWHVHGNWGYFQDGRSYVSYDLPGRDDAWDALYEIKPNPAFEK